MTARPPFMSAAPTPWRTPPSTRTVVDGAAATVSRWPARISRRSRPRCVRATTLSPTRSTVRPPTARSSAATRSASGPSDPLGDGTATSSAARASRSFTGPGGGRSRAHAVLAQDGVQVHLVVALARLEPAQNQHAGQEELAPRELPAAAARDGDRPRRHDPPVDLGPGLGVDDRDGRVEDGPGPEHRSPPDPGPVGHHAPAAHEGIVLDHD